MLPPFYNVNHVLVNQQTRSCSHGKAWVHHITPPAPMPMAGPWEGPESWEDATLLRPGSSVLVWIVWWLPDWRIQGLGETCSFYSISQQERSVWWEDRRGALARRKQGRRDMPRAWHKVHCAAQFMPHRLCSIMLRWRMVFGKTVK